MRKLRHEDLVAFALGDTEADCTPADIESDAEAGAELNEIERHLALHEALPELQPEPRLWRGLQEKIAAEPPRRPLLQRFWMPAAAAALIAAAFFLPRSGDEQAPRPRTLHGDVTQTASGSWSSRSVSRLTCGDGVTVTLDGGTIVEFPSEQRLALRAGRIFLEVAKSRRGFTVEAGGVTVETTGTAFGVALSPAGVAVEVEEGSVLCTVPGGPRALAAGRRLLVADAGSTESAAAAPRSWFMRPAITANILDATTIRVVIRNDMPDAIQLAPPTAGEPLFFASYGEHDYPLTVAPGTLGSRPATLAPGAELTLEPLRLPRPLKAREALFITWPAQGLKVEAGR